MRQLISYAAIGVANTAIGLGLITLALWAGMGDYPANALGFAAGLAFSFVMNRRFTFHFAGRIDPSEVARFLFCFALAYGANLAAVGLGRTVGLSGNPLIHLAGMATYSVLFYLLLRQFAFAEGRSSLATANGALSETGASGPSSAQTPAGSRVADAIEGVFAAANERLALRAYWLVACGLVALLQLILILQHEPWRDEWQALQIAVQSPGWSDLLANLRFEGHPPLWYALLRALAWLLGPYAALPAASVLIAAVGQYLILARAPFSRVERLALAFSEFLLFEYFTVSRSLSLGVLLVLVAAALAKRRSGWLAIALLPLCDFQFGVISLGLVAWRWRDRLLWWPGLILWTLCGALAAWSVIPDPEMVPAGLQRGFWVETLSFMDRLGTVLLPLQWDSGLRWDSVLPPAFAALGWAAFLIMAWLLTAKDRFERALLFGFVAICWLFSVFVYALSVRHVMLIAVVMVGLRWVSSSRTADHVWRLWLTGAAVCGVVTASTALTMPFDTSRQTAQAIAALGVTGEHWMSFPSEHGQGVAALTRIRLEKPEQACWQQFVRWNEPARIDLDDELEAILPDRLRRNGRFYLLASRPLAIRSVPSRKLAVIPPGFNKQGYALYEIGPGLPSRNWAIPPCVGDQRPLSAEPAQLGRGTFSNSSKFPSYSPSRTPQRSSSGPSPANGVSAR